MKYYAQKIAWKSDKSIVSFLQSALQSHECQASSEPPRKKAHTCTKCGQPRRGHPRNRCLASDLHVNSPSHCTVHLFHLCREIFCFAASSLILSGKAW